MKFFKIIFTTAAACIVVGIASIVHAQNTATVQITATVLDPVTITSSTGMDFGDDILPGISRSISREDAAAAKFSLTAVGGNSISVNFTLPDVLVHEVNGDEMPIIFGPNDASASIDEVVSGSTSFDPNSITSQQVSGLGSDLFIWLGGTIHPRGDQSAGIYTGDITLDLTYTES